MTSLSGICSILPDSHISDFEFDPCGYSINSVEGTGISAIHVTPEEGFSYASLEAAGYDLKAVNLGQLIERVLACFQPHDFSVAVHANFACKWLERICSLDLKAYSLGQKSHEDLGMGGSVIHQVFGSWIVDLQGLF